MTETNRPTSVDLLQTITAQRRQDISMARRCRPDAECMNLATSRQHRSLRDRILGASGTPQIIAEIKRASPSAGPIRPDLSPTDLALDYQNGGAAAISVLTEPHYFQGHDADLQAVRTVTTIPLLRKDFIISEYQVLETAALGADVVLLIVAALDECQLRDFYQTAIALRLEVLIEAHDLAELEQALAHPRALIGVNNRNLKTLVTDLAVARELAGSIPAERIAVAESGLRSAADIQALQALGYRAFLVGEHLLSSGSPRDNLRALRVPA